MFTGLVEEIGAVALVRNTAGSAEISIECATVLKDLQTGDSIAVNGVCLTATSVGAGCFKATATPETLSRTNLGSIQKGASVNLERSLTLQSRIGGHLVQGHIDGTGRTVSIDVQGEAQTWGFHAPSDLLRQLVFKGSIAVNGVSLTVASLETDKFSVALIPKTIELTNFRSGAIGDLVNLEVDVIGKYVFRFLEQAKPSSAGTVV